jgi:hypothetical protein
MASPNYSPKNFFIAQTPVDKHFKAINKEFIFYNFGKIFEEKKDYKPRHLSTLNFGASVKTFLVS